MAKLKRSVATAAAVTLLRLVLLPWRSAQCVGLEQERRLLVDMTLVSGAASTGAVCLDGSAPAYHLHRGSGAGDRNWLLQFEGGGWCNDVASCAERSRTRRGSTLLMNKLEVFSGILSNDSTMNPDFYNWNRVKLRYCDGASFGGDSQYLNGERQRLMQSLLCSTFISETTFETNNPFEFSDAANALSTFFVFDEQPSVLYFRGQRIWRAIVLDLLPKGLIQADKVLLSGCSAGGLATFLHCDDLTMFLPATAAVKCMSDAGFFLDVRDISGNNTIESFFKSLVTLQGVQKSLNQKCASSRSFTYQCLFPQYALTYIKAPYFILNSAYDVYQFHHIFVPPSADPRGYWNHCKMNTSACSPSQLAILQGFRNEMLTALETFEGSISGGMFINSCFTHCQSELQEAWFGPNSPRLHNKTIAEVVGDWYFERKVAKEIDCPHPCGSTCDNSVLPSQGGAFYNPLRGCAISSLLLVMCVLLQISMI